MCISNGLSFVGNHKKLLYWRICLLVTNDSENTSSCYRSPGKNNRRNGTSSHIWFRNTSFGLANHVLCNRCIATFMYFLCLSVRKLGGKWMSGHGKHEVRTCLQISTWMSIVTKVLSRTSKYVPEIYCYFIYIWFVLLIHLYIIYEFQAWSA